MTDTIEIKLPAHHKEALERAVERSHALDKLLNRAQIAGLDVKHLQEQNVKERSQAQALKTAFFPEL